MVKVIFESSSRSNLRERLGKSQKLIFPFVQNKSHGIFGRSQDSKYSDNLFDI